MTPIEFKLWRVARGLSQVQCARLFGVSQAAISFWERKTLPRNIHRRMELLGLDHRNSWLKKGNDND